MLTTGLVDRLAGLPAGTLKRMVFVGALRPAVGTDRRGRPMLWTETQALGVVAMRNLRQRGATMPAALAMMEFLASRTIDDLKADWQADRHFLLVMGDALFPGQIERSSITDNQVVRDIAAAQDSATPIIAFDVRLGWEGLQKRLAEIRRNAPPRGRRPKANRVSSPEPVA